MTARGPTGQSTGQSTGRPARGRSEAVTVAGAATPRGRFPHARRAGDLVFISGTSARRPDGSIAGARIVDEMGTADLDIRAQTRAVIDNLLAILAAMGGAASDLVQVTTYLADINDFGGYNQVYGEYFDTGGPARTTVAVHRLPHPHLLIEIQAVAYLPEPGVAGRQAGPVEKGGQP